MRLISLLLASLLPGFAQDAASLIRKSADALNIYRSYRYTEEMTIDAAMPGGISMTTVVSGVPRKLRRETGSGGLSAVIMITTGDSTVIYMLMAKQYSRMKAGETSIVANTSLATPEELAANAKVLRSEILEVDGKPHDCWVVESRPEHVDAGPVGPQLGDAIVTTWYDKALGLDLQMTMSSKMTLGDTTTAVASKVTKHGFQFNLVLPDSLFVFTPPEGVTETGDLSLGMAPSVEKPATKVTTPGTARAVDGEPQAYVPNLRPLEFLEPVWPTGAKTAGLHGMVQLLVTVDPGGRVVNVEPLTGSKALRQAAIDTARQWKFRPVIREGLPVFAYTDGMVEFMDEDKPLAPEPPADMAEEMKAVARTMALQAKFPRTPAQVLADTEQSLGGMNGQDRAYALPDLAKTALKAGALDKAVSYAQEALRYASQTERPQLDWNYGNEIYTGNMVLGLVAFRQDNVLKARQYLLDSAKTPGSPVLGSFGPDFQLASELLKKGERDTVLAFLESCKGFWKMGGDRLDAMIAKVRAGGEF